MTRWQNLKYLYWTIYEWAKYPHLRKQHSMWQHVVYSFYRLYTVKNWYNTAQKIHNGQKRGKRRKTKITKVSKLRASYEQVKPRNKCETVKGK